MAGLATACKGESATACLLSTSTWASAIALHNWSPDFRGDAVAAAGTENLEGAPACSDLGLGFPYHCLAVQGPATGFYRNGRKAMEVTKTPHASQAVKYIPGPALAQKSRAFCLGVLGPATF